MNLDKFAKLIGCEGWGEVNKVNSANEKYEKFIDTYNKHYDTCFETKSVRRKNQRKNSKPWILPWLEDACARKNKAFHKKITSPSPENISKYNKLKAFTDKHVQLANKKFYSDYFDKHQLDSR